MRSVIAALALGFAISQAAAQDTESFDLNRAQSNYAALVQGTKQFHQLTLFEQRELLELRRRISEGDTDDRSPRERCEDEQIQRLRSKEPTALDRRHIDMSCRGEKD